MEAEKEKGAATAPLSNTHHNDTTSPHVWGSPQATALHWRRIYKAYRLVGPDAALHEAHRIKMLKAGWSV